MFKVVHCGLEQHVMYIRAGILLQHLVLILSHIVQRDRVEIADGHAGKVQNLGRLKVQFYLFVIGWVMLLFSQAEVIAV